MGGQRVLWGLNFWEITNSRRPCIFTCLLLGLFWGSRFSYDIRTSVACCDDPAAGANVRSSLFAVTSLLQTKSTSLRAIDSQAILDTIICEIAKFF